MRNEVEVSSPRERDQVDPDTQEPVGSPDMDFGSLPSPTPPPWSNPEDAEVDPSCDALHLMPCWYATQALRLEYFGTSAAAVVSRDREERTEIDFTYHRIGRADTARSR